jgi:plastocyanin
MNKTIFGIIVTGIPLAIAIGAVMGWYGSTGGVLSPMARPDQQTPPTTVIPVTIETRGGQDVLVNPGGRENPDFVSLPFGTLTLQITNNSQNTHTITVPETGASSGPIKPGETKSLDISYDTVGDISYKSEDGQIQGKVLIRKQA